LWRGEFVFQENQVGVGMNEIANICWVEQADVIIFGLVMLNNEIRSI